MDISKEPCISENQNRSSQKKPGMYRAQFAVNPSDVIRDGYIRGCPTSEFKLKRVVTKGVSGIVGKRVSATT